MHHSQYLYDFWHSHINSTQTKLWTNYHSHIYDLPLARKVYKLFTNKYKHIIGNFFSSVSFYRRWDCLVWCVAWDDYSWHEPVPGVTMGALMARLMLQPDLLRDPVMECPHPVPAHWLLAPRVSLLVTLLTVTCSVTQGEISNQNMIRL